MDIYLLDRDADMAREWSERFAGVSGVTVVQDDFARFMDAHPHIDCIVSPANSYGLMDGGYDAAITAYFGDALIPAVQAHIRAHYACEQPVGTSCIVAIPGTTKRLIHTPTMRVPSVIRDPLVVYQCTRTALLCAREHGASSVVLPAFGGSCGKVPQEHIALLMRAAYDQLQTQPEVMDWDYASRVWLEAWRDRTLRERLWLKDSL